MAAKDDATILFAATILTAPTVHMYVRSSQHLWVDIYVHTRLHPAYSMCVNTYSDRMNIWGLLFISQEFPIEK